MARTGQITVTTADTAVQGPDEPGTEFYLIAHPDNTDAAYVGNDGSNDVSSTTGFPLSVSANAGPNSVLVSAGNLNEFWFDVTTNGDKVCWIKKR